MNNGSLIRSSKLSEQNNLFIQGNSSGLSVNNFPNGQSHSQTRSRRQTIQTLSESELLNQSNWNLVGNTISEHLHNLRRSNLIAILSSKQSEQRNQRQNRLIMQMLKYEQFFQPICNNYKSLADISSKLQYRFFKQGQMIYRINQFTEGYFILVRGSVQLSIPQKIINNTKIKVESQTQVLLREIEDKHKREDKHNRSRKNRFKYQRNKTQKKEKQSTEKQTQKNQIQKTEQNNQNLQERDQDLSQKSQKQNDEDQDKNHEQFDHKSNISSPVSSPIIQPIMQTKKTQSKISQISGIKRGISRLSGKNSDHTQKQNSNSKQKNKTSINSKLSKRQSTIIKSKSKKKSAIKKDDVFWSPTQFHLQDSDDAVLSDQDELKSDDSNFNDGFVSKHKNEVDHAQQIYQDKIVKIVEQGECFGQITVGQINKRATNAKARYDCHLIMIRKQHYDLISKASLSTEMKKRHQFLLNLQLFKKVYRYSVQGFLYYLQEVPCQYKSVLYKQGEPITHVYIIKNGEFNLCKTIHASSSKRKHQRDKSKTIDVTEYEDAVTSLRRHQHNWRQGILKAVFPGQIIGDAQTLLKKDYYNQSCKCQSQNGVVYKIEKNVFIQKLMAPQNQINLIKRFLTMKYKNKVKYVDSFVDKQLKNETIARILPASRSCDTKLKKRIELKRTTTSLDHMSNRNDINKSVSAEKSKNNFFDEFHRTFYQVKQNKRLSVRHAVNFTENSGKKEIFVSKRCNTSTNQVQCVTPANKQKNSSSNLTIQQVPTCIKDIVKVVNCKQRYFKNRNKNSSRQINFEFQTHKLPRFIEQKFKYLLQRIKKK